MDYLVRLVQANESFRRPELEALARLSSSKVEVKDYKDDSPFCVIRLPEQMEKTADKTARSFISRSVLAKGIYELWGQGSNYDELNVDVKKRTEHLWSSYSNVSFKFSVDAYCCKRSSAEQREIINSFSYLGFRGRIVMSKPDEEFVVFEEWEAPSSEERSLSSDGKSKRLDVEPAPRTPERLFLGRLVGGTSRHLIDKHDLKKRPYISTTSMDAELALVTANLALASSGRLFLDPFVGTGGFMVAAAELGAISFGSDIDGRSFRGKGPGVCSGVGANFDKYGLEHLWGDCLISDLTNTPFRSTIGSRQPRRRWLDGIICDPPYGVREGLKVLGTRQRPLVESNVDSATQVDTMASGQPYLINGIPAHLLPGYVAPKKPYSFDLMLRDILDFAARTLVDGGRLAFWMPSANETDEESSIPSHVRLELKHVCLQSFNKWSRRLLVYERMSQHSNEPDATEWSRDIIQPAAGSADELNPFRKRYFQGFT